MEHLYSKHQKYYNNKCDLYCLGIILYMFKTCEYIFEVKTFAGYRDRAKRIVDNWNKNAKEIYPKILNLLLKKD